MSVDVLEDSDLEDLESTVQDLQHDVSRLKQLMESLEARFAVLEGFAPETPPPCSIPKT